MKPPDPHPTPDDLRAMAYADGELDSSERAAFERRLEEEPALARQVSEYHALARFADRLAPPEPADFEWRRLERDPLQRLGLKFGWLLSASGAAGLLAWGLYALWHTDLGITPKILFSTLTGGLTILGCMTLRARIRVIPYDPYRQVQR